MHAVIPDCICGYTSIYTPKPTVQKDMTPVVLTYAPPAHSFV